MSGNWSLAATETTGNGNGPLTTLNGSISEQTSTTPSDYVTAVFQVSSGCFGNAAVVPLSGSVTQLQFQVISFGINAQFLTLNTTKNAAATTMSGTYSIDGGCSNGQMGTVTGVRYTPLTGDYSGTTAATPAQTVALTVAQNGSGTGVGTTALTGTASFSGISCFTTGTIGAAAVISGPNFSVPITTNEGTAGSQVLLTGTIDQAASTMTVTQAQVVTGACAGSLGQIALTKSS